MKKSSNILTDNSSIAYYPKDKDVHINNSDLCLELEDYSKAIKNDFSFFNFLTLFALRTTLFTSEFKSFVGVSGNDVKMAYIAFCTAGTAVILRPLMVSFYKRLIVTFRLTKKFEKFLHKSETDPRKKASGIVNAISRR